MALIMTLSFSSRKAITHEYDVLPGGAFYYQVGNIILWYKKIDYYVIELHYSIISFYARQQFHKLPFYAAPDAISSKYYTQAPPTSGIPIKS